VYGGEARGVNEIDCPQSSLQLSEEGHLSNFQPTQK